MKTVFIAGATGYLGRYLCAEYQHRGWYVIALVRNTKRAQDLSADRLVQAEATRPETLGGVMDRADLVISALGITRQADGLGYWDVDYQANANLLNEAQRSGVNHFGYIHVLHADQMAQVPLFAAKSAFVRKLQMSAIQSTIISPSGYFSDMRDFLAMARKGRVWLFGKGEKRINPIHGKDLAVASFDAIAQGNAWCDIGGPDTFTQNELANLCFDTLNKPARITHLPDVLRRSLIFALPKIAPRRIAGPAQFFLTALSMDMLGPHFGTNHLADHFRQLSASN